MASKTLCRICLQVEVPLDDLTNDSTAAMKEIFNIDVPCICLYVLEFHK